MYWGFKPHFVCIRDVLFCVYTHVSTYHYFNLILAVFSTLKLASTAT